MALLDIGGNAFFPLDLILQVLKLRIVRDRALVGRASGTANDEDGHRHKNESAHGQIRLFAIRPVFS